MEKAKALGKLIERTSITYDKWTINVTASIGVAWAPAGFSGSNEDLVKAADAMLYRSKDNGRNRVSGMVLRYPIDFDHIGGTHLVDGDSGSDNNSVPRIHKT